MGAGDGYADYIRADILIDMSTYLHCCRFGGGGMGWLGIAPLMFIFGIFYFLLILPQQRRQKKWQAMLDELKTGDRVTTSGGLRGTIIALER